MFWFFGKTLIIVSPVVSRRFPEACGSANCPAPNPSMGGRNGADIFQVTSDLPPVGSLPKDLMATATFIKMLQPGECSRRYPILDLFLGHFMERSPTRHAARLAHRQAEMTKNKGHLLLLAEAVRNEQGGHFPVPDDANTEDSRIRREQDSFFAQSLADQLPVADIGFPGSIVAGSPEPTGQAAEHGIARELGRERVHDVGASRTRCHQRGGAGDSSSSLSGAGNRLHVA